MQAAREGTLRTFPYAKKANGSAWLPLHQLQFAQASRAAVPAGPPARHRQQQEARWPLRQHLSGVRR